jgi:hypothetical protein
VFWNVSTGPFGLLKSADYLIMNGASVVADAGAGATKNGATGIAAATANAAARFIGPSPKHAG